MVRELDQLNDLAVAVQLNKKAKTISRCGGNGWITQKALKWGRVYRTCIAHMVVTIIKAMGLSTGSKYTWMNPEGTSASSSAELLPILLSISSLSARHMPAPFILDSRQGTPSPQCQVLSAKFQQLVSALKEPKTSVLLLIGGPWSSLCPPVLQSSLLHLATGKTLLFSATSSELPFKYTHTSARSSCWLSWVFCEGNEPKFARDLGENDK